MAGCGRGKDDPPPDEAARARLRKQALEWLEAERAALGRILDGGDVKARAGVAQVIQHWKEDADLAGVRDPEALTKLSAAEQEAWRALVERPGLPAQQGPWRPPLKRRWTVPPCRGGPVLGKMHLDDPILQTRNPRPDPGGTRDGPPMIFARRRRIEIGQTPDGGLMTPNRPGDGVMVLDLAPQAGRPVWPAWLLLGLPDVLLCVTAFSIASISFQPPLEDLFFSAFLAAMSLVLSYTAPRHSLSLEQIRLNSSGLGYLWVNGLIRKHRVIPFPEIRRLIPYTVMVPEGRYQKFHPEYGLAIETSGRPLCVGQGRDPDAPDRLREVLEGYLQDRYANWVDRPLLLRQGRRSCRSGFPATPLNMRG